MYKAFHFHKLCINVNLSGSFEKCIYALRLMYWLWKNNFYRKLSLECSSLLRRIMLQPYTQWWNGACKVAYMDMVTYKSKLLTCMAKSTLKPRIKVTCSTIVVSTCRCRLLLRKYECKNTIKEIFFSNGFIYYMQSSYDNSL